MHAIRNNRLTKIFVLLVVMLAFNIIGTYSSDLPLVGVDRAEAGGPCIIKFCYTGEPDENGFPTFGWVCRARIGAEIGTNCGTICPSECL